MILVLKKYNKKLKKQVCLVGMKFQVWKEKKSWLSVIQHRAYNSLRMC